MLRLEPTDLTVRNQTCRTSTRTAALDAKSSHYVLATVKSSVKFSIDKAVLENLSTQRVAEMLKKKKNRCRLNAVLGGSVITSMSPYEAAQRGAESPTHLSAALN